MCGDSPHIRLKS